MNFLNPYFLFGLFAVAIPIAVHLFNFRKFKKVYFTNVKLLQEIEIRTKKQNKLYNYLLLLFRCLTVIFIALLFSQPYIADEDKALVQQGENAVLIFVDNSFSMENSTKSGNLLEEAKGKAREIAGQYSNSDVFCLMTMDMLGRHRHFVNKERFLELLSEIEISPSSKPFSEILKSSHNLIRTNTSDSRRCFYISDFQSSCFDVENFPDDSVENIFVPLHSQNADNVFIDSIWFDNKLFRASQVANLNVRVCNWSDNPVEKLPLKLFVEDKQVAIASVDIQAKQSQTSTLGFVIPDDALIHARLSIMDNPVCFDDDFYFTLLVNEKVKTLIINGESENVYLNRLFGQDEDVEITNVSVNNPDYGSFPKYSVIILNELRDISSGLLNELKKALDNSASLIILPSTEMETSSVNASLLQMGVPPYSDLEKTPTRVIGIDTDNGLFNGVFSSIDENIEMPEVSSHFPITKTGATAYQSIMKLSNGDDFLIAVPKDNSNVYMFSSPLQESCTDFVKQSLFVPVLWNMCAMSQIMSRTDYVLGRNEFIDFSSFANAQTQQVLTVKKLHDENSFIPQTIRRNNKTGLLLNNQARTAGNYNVFQQDSLLAGFSLNYPRTESKLEFLSDSDIKSLLEKQGISNARVFSEKGLLETQFAKSEAEFSFTWILLLLCLLSIASELFLLYRIRTKT